jgi:diacylglycerol kinase (ATP)
MSKKDKPMRVKLIANPGAGDVLKSASKLEEVTTYLLEAGLDVDVALAKPKRKAVPIARKAAKEGFDAIIAMGGDGTIGAVVRGMAGYKSRLGIIPAGHSNDLAASLGIPSDLKAACELIAAGESRKVDLGVINTKDRKDFYFNQVAAIGLTATLYSQVSKVPNGRYAGILDAIRTIFNYQTKPIVRLTLDGESKIEVETMLVTIVNTPLTGIRNMVAPLASMDDGLLDIAVYPGFSKAELLNYFVRTLNENDVPDGRIQRYRAKKIKIKTIPDLDISGEGIIVGCGKAVIEVKPGMLRLIAPPVGAGAEKPQPEAAVELPEPVSPVQQ